MGIFGVIAFYGRLGFFPLLPGVVGVGVGLGLTVGVAEDSGVGATGATAGSVGAGLEEICGAVNKKTLAVPLGTLEMTFVDPLDFSC